MLRPYDPDGESVWLAHGADGTGYRAQSAQVWTTGSLRNWILWRSRTAVAVAGLSAAQGVRVGVRYQADDVASIRWPETCRSAAAWRQPCSKGEPMAVTGCAAQRTAVGRPASGPARRAVGGRT